MTVVKRVSAAKRPTFRERVRVIMEPYDGTEGTGLGLFVDIFVLVCILVSCALIPLEMVYPHLKQEFWIAELAFTGIFIVEYGFRWYSAKNRLTYPFGFYAVIDFLAILPTLLLLGAQMMMLRFLRTWRLLRFLRLLRLARMLKFWRYGQLMYRALNRLRIMWSAVNYQYRLEQLGRLFIWVLVFWFVGANMLYFTENQSLGGHKGPFANYWESYWSMVIVLISGHDIDPPLSVMGRVEVTGLLIAGICAVGMLTGEIVSILVQKVERAGKLAIKPPDAVFRDHIVILGANDHLDTVIMQVHAALEGRSFILVVAEQANELVAADARVYRKVFALTGDPASGRILEQANIDQALRVIVLSPEEEGLDPGEQDARTLMKAIAAYREKRRVERLEKRTIPMVVQLQLQETLRHASQLEGVDFIVSRHYGERLISQAVLHPGVTEVYERLMNFMGENNEFYTIPVPEHLRGRSFKQAQLDFLENDEEAVILVGVDRSPDNRPNTRFWLTPGLDPDGVSPADRKLLDTDRLVVIAFERPRLWEPELEEVWSGKILPRD